MLDYKLLPDEGIVCIHPESPLQARDFVALKEMIERYLSSHEKLNGLLIASEDSLGWEEFSEWVGHLTLARDELSAIVRIATVSNPQMPDIDPSIHEYFTQSEIKHFSPEEKNQAISWVNHTTVQ